MSGSFVTRRAETGELEIIELDDDLGFDDVGLSEDLDTLRRGQSVDVGGRRGVLTGFSRDRNSVYVRFNSGARRVPVEEVTPVR